MLLQPLFQPIILLNQLLIHLLILFDLHDQRIPIHLHQHPFLHRLLQLRLKLFTLRLKLSTPILCLLQLFSVECRCKVTVILLLCYYLTLLLYQIV